MGKILSLSKVRKTLAKAEKEKKANNNRIKFGRTKGEKDLAKAREGLADKKLDDKKLDDKKLDDKKLDDNKKI